MYSYNHDHALALVRKLPQRKSWFLIVVSFVLIAVYGVCLASVPSGIGAGAHDLVFAAVRYVGDKPAGRESDFAVLAHRMNLFVGRNEFPAYTLLENLEHTPRRSGFDAEIRFVNSTSNVSPDEDGGSRALLSVAVGNMLEQSLTHAFLLFSGDVQIAAMDGDADTGVKPAFFIVEPQSVVRANVHILQQRERLWALVIESPYALLEEKPGIMTKIPMAVRISNVLD